METLRRFEVAHNGKLLDQMRACFHDDASIESVASNGRALDPDATIEALAAAFNGGWYSIGDWTYQQIAPDLIVSCTSTRKLLPGGHGVSHDKVYRLTQGRDGLMWRVRLCASRAEAAAEVEKYGQILGI